MKKIVMILVMVLGVTTVTWAQDNGDDGKEGGGRVQALYIAYLTRKLNLSTDEAQKFWPIFNKYMDELKNTRRESRANKEPEIKLEEKMLNIRKKYNDEFGKALSSEKVNSFFRAEKEFGTVLRKEIQDRQMQRMENRKRLKNNP